MRVDPVRLTAEAVAVFHGQVVLLQQHLALSVQEPDPAAQIHFCPDIAVFNDSDDFFMAILRGPGLHPDLCLMRNFLRQCPVMGGKAMIFCCPDPEAVFAPALDAHQLPAALIGQYAIFNGKTILHKLWFLPECSVMFFNYCNGPGTKYQGHSL